MKVNKTLPFLFFVVLSLTLEFLIRNQVIPAYLLPAPSTILQSFWSLKDDFLLAVSQTLMNSLKGFLIAFLFAFGLAVLFSFSEILRAAIFPYAVFFQTVPIIAIAPLLVIWLGFGSPTVIASSAMVSFFPILANSMMGLHQYSYDLFEFFQIHQATRVQILIRLQIPSAIEQILTGLKIASGLAVIGAIVGEFIAGSGLGGLIDSARTQQRVDLVFAALILSSLLGLFYIGIIQLIEYFWRKVLRLNK